MCFLIVYFAPARRLNILFITCIINAENSIEE